MMIRDSELRKFIRSTIVKERFEGSFRKHNYGFFEAIANWAKNKSSKRKTVDKDGNSVDLVVISPRDHDVEELYDLETKDITPARGLSADLVKLMPNFAISAQSSSPDAVNFDADIKNLETNFLNAQNTSTSGINPENAMIAYNTIVPVLLNLQVGDIGQRVYNHYADTDKGREAIKNDEVVPGYSDFLEDTKAESLKLFKEKFYNAAKDISKLKKEGIITQQEEEKATKFIDLLDSVQ